MASLLPRIPQSPLRITRASAMWPFTMISLVMRSKLWSYWVIAKNIYLRTTIYKTNKLQDDLVYCSILGLIDIFFLV